MRKCRKLPSNTALAVLPPSSQHCLPSTLRSVENDRDAAFTISLPGNFGKRQTEILRFFTKRYRDTTIFSAILPHKNIVPATMKLCSKKYEAAYRNNCKNCIYLIYHTTNSMSTEENNCQNI